MIRCKFVCGNKSVNAGGQGEYISLTPVYSGSEENKAFFASTPGGQIQFYTINPDASAAFEIGKEYFVDFTPASIPVPPPNTNPCGPTGCGTTPPIAP